MVLILEYSGRDDSTIVIEDVHSCIILLTAPRTFADLMKVGHV